ncbi:hypothetical protein LTR64_000301 [Lithohypha guttulata]|uniref:uncharacterized protein n=1 Tax=Lithohypha guttulata TaxID=1690604 RepID=UPI002DDEF2B4|nr:hypothetical protein LTR51_007662 [Lithohypha guttulata]
MSRFTTAVSSPQAQKIVDNRGSMVTKTVTRNQPQASSPTAPRLSYSSLNNPFPQEFEFAKQIHDSVPASPATPVVGNGEQKGSIDSGFDIIDAYSSGERSGTAGEVSKKNSACSLVLRHPLHTFILPLLCSACQTQRLQNIARFEALTIKESIDRDVRKGDGLGGVVDAERKKIARRSTGKGKLIPLICVEEGRIRRREVRKSTLKQIELKLGGELVVGEEHKEDQVTSNPEEDGESTSGIQKPATKTEAMTASSGSASKGSKVAGSHGVEQDTHSTNVSITPIVPAATPAPSSSWSWWGRSTVVTSAPSFSAAAKTVPAAQGSGQAHRGTTTKTNASKAAKAESGQPKSASTVPSASRPMSPGIDWSGMQERWKGINNNVSRDVFGRNAKGMNRIMGFEGARSEEAIGTMGKWFEP